MPSITPVHNGFRGRRGSRRPAAAWLSLAALIFGQSATIVRADQVISTAVSGPVFGNNAGIVITATGSVINGVGGAALQTNATDTITTLANAGSVAGYHQGLFNDANTITSISNTSSIAGGEVGILTSGAIGSLENDSYATITSSGGVGLKNSTGGLITTLTNRDFAIVSGYARGVQNDAGATITQLDNSGTLSGQYALFNAGTITAFSNAVGGTLDASDLGFVVSGVGASVGTLANSGTIKSAGGQGLNVSGGATVTTLSNLVDGKIQGGYSYGLAVDSSGGASSIGTLSNAGAITGPDRGVFVYEENASIATLANSGTASGGLVGITVERGTIASLTNLAVGLIQGTGYDGIQNIAGTITTIDNSGDISGLGRSGIRNEEYYGDAHIGTITNQAGGTVSGVDHGIGNVSYATGYNATIDSIDNAGTLSGGSHGVYSNGALTTLTNTGLVSGGDKGVVLYSPAGTLNLLDNSGRIEATNSASYGVQADGATITTLTNSGTIVGDWNGVRTDYYATIGTITNGATGMIQGTNYDGIINVGSEMTTIDNSGVISGPGRSGILNADFQASAHIGTITNRAGASISGGTEGIYNLQGYGYNATIDSISNFGTVSGGSHGVRNDVGVITSLVNSGTILGGTAAVANQGGTIGSLDNSGTVGDVQNVFGVIHSVTNTGQFGDLTNSGVIGTGSGTAISSTGVGASIGEIYNQGTISGGLTIENQDVVVHGNTSPFFGLIDNGTIDIKNGSLTFADGSTYLDSDVVVSSLAGTAGAGTMTNQGELILGTSHNVDGSFAQSAAGVLTLVLYGTLPGEYGALVGTGSASIDGILNLEQGFAIADGQSFSLLSFASAVGAFAGLSVDGTPLSSLGGGQWAYAGLILTEILSGGNYSISVTSSAVPEIDPAGLAGVMGLVAAAFSLAERRRQRTPRR